MRYGEALIGLENGACARRQGWPPQHFISSPRMRVDVCFFDRLPLASVGDWATQQQTLRTPRIHAVPRLGAIFMFFPNSTFEGYVPCAEDMIAGDWEHYRL